MSTNDLNGNIAPSNFSRAEQERREIVAAVAAAATPRQRIPGPRAIAAAGELLSNINALKSEYETLKPEFDAMPDDSDPAKLASVAARLALIESRCHAMEDEFALYQATVLPFAAARQECASERGAESTEQTAEVGPTPSPAVLPQATAILWNGEAAVEQDQDDRLDDGSIGSTLLRNAEEYLATVPGAASGERGHRETYRIACVLFDLGLTHDQALGLLSAWNETCESPLTTEELEHKLAAAVDAERKPSPYRLITPEGAELEYRFPPFCEMERRAASTIDAELQAKLFLLNTATHREHDEHELRLRLHNGVYWWWTGDHYRELPDGDIKDKVVQHLRMEGFLITTSSVSNVMLCLRSMTNIGSHREMPCWLDGRQGGIWLPMRNGILNLEALLAGETDILVPHTPRYFSASVLPYDFDPSAECPLWQAHLHRCLEGDAGRIAVLQQFYGSCLKPGLEQQKFLFNEGTGANGKSVANAAMEGVFGAENVSAVPLENFGDRFALHCTLGMMVNIAGDVAEVDKAAEGILKAYTSGDAMKFERKYKDPVTARPTAKLIFSGNARPRFSDKSEGLWRRMILMPWNFVIPFDERVLGMDTPSWWRSRGELPGILLWAIEGLRQLERQGGFTASTVCAAALVEYKRESNPARMFLEENYILAPLNFVQCEDIYGRYGVWAKSNGYSPLGAATFGREIRRVFPAVERRKIPRCTDREWAYFGIVRGR